MADGGDDDCGLSPPPDSPRSPGTGGAAMPPAVTPAGPPPADRWPTPSGLIGEPPPPPPPLPAAAAGGHANTHANTLRREGSSAERLMLSLQGANMLLVVRSSSTVQGSQPTRASRRRRCLTPVRTARRWASRRA